jgi:hypothetical protein
MPDAHKAFGQDVQQETANKLLGVEAHWCGDCHEHSPGGRHAAILEAYQAVIRDRHAVGVAGDVVEHLLGAGERALGIHQPVVGIELAQETPPLARFAQARLGVGVQRPVLHLLGRLHIDSDTDSDIANVHRSLGLADEHDVD